MPNSSHTYLYLQYVPEISIDYEDFKAILDVVRLRPVNNKLVIKVTSNEIEMDKIRVIEYRDIFYIKEEVM